MTLVLALAIAVVFGAGAVLVLKRDLLRVAAGVALISGAANLLLMAAGLSRGAAPVHPLPAGAPVSDPLVQALALTALVIGFGTSALLLTLVFRVFTSQRSISQTDMRRAEESDEAARGAD